MVCCRVTTDLADFPRMIDDRLNVSIFRIPQHLDELACRPVFVAFLILLTDTTEGGVMSIGKALGIHGTSGVVAES